MDIKASEINNNIEKKNFSREKLCKGDVEISIYKNILSVIGLDNHDLILQWVKKKKFGRLGIW
jgi:hypothetical protein